MQLALFCRFIRGFVVKKFDELIQSATPLFDQNSHHDRFSYSNHANETYSSVLPKNFRGVPTWVLGIDFSRGLPPSHKHYPKMAPFRVKKT